MISIISGPGMKGLMFREGLNPFNFWIGLVNWGDENMRMTSGLKGCDSWGVFIYVYFFGLSAVYMRPQGRKESYIKYERMGGGFFNAFGTFTCG